MSDNPGPDKKAPPPKSTNGPLMLALANTVAMLAATGLLVYTRMMYKRPVITETSERDRLSEIVATPLPPTVSALIPFESITANISPAPPRADGKAHYLTFTFSLEVRDEEKKDLIDEIKPLFLDKILSILGKKSFQELSSVEGHYNLRTQIQEAANDLLNHNKIHAPGESHLSGKEPGENLVTAIYFTNFVVQ